jgi:hypothetical protein
MKSLRFRQTGLSVRYRDATAFKAVECSLERLATAVLMEMDEDWQSGTRYLTFS